MATKNPFVDTFGELSSELLLNIAGILSLRLPEGPERVIAAKWVKKFQACDPKDYKQNLSLFVMCLTKQILVDPFNVAPIDPASAQWPKFEREYTLHDINSAVVCEIYKDSLTPPYKIEVSNTLREYVCYQNIPFFGAHFYYAFSPHETIDKWSKFNKLNIPKNQIESLRHEDVSQPIATRRRVGTPGGHGTKNNKKVLRPAWEGPIPDEFESEASVLQPMMSIPLSISKPIPVALKKRMEASLAKSKLVKEKRTQNQLNKGTVTPSTSKTDTRRNLYAKSTLHPINRKGRGGIITPSTRQRREDYVTLRAIPQKPKTPPRSSSPRTPEFTGPFVDQQKALHRLRAANPPAELVQSTRDMKELSEAILNETERLQQGGEANFKNVSRIEKGEAVVGSAVAKMIEHQQTSELITAATNGAEATGNLIQTMEQLNNLTRPIVTANYEEIRRKLNIIKQSMNRNAERAENLLAQNEMDSNNELLEQLRVVRDSNIELADKLQTLNKSSNNDEILIEGLVNQALNSATQAEELSNNLTNAIEQNQTDLPKFRYSTAKEISNLLDESFPDDGLYVNTLNQLEDENVRIVAQNFIRDNQAKMEKTFIEQCMHAKINLRVNKFLKPEQIERKWNIPFTDERLDDSVNLSLELVEDIADTSQIILYDSNEAIDLIEYEINPVLEDVRENIEDEGEKSILDEIIADVHEAHEELSECLHVAGAINATLDVEKSQNR